MKNQKKLRNFTVLNNLTGIVKLIQAFTWKKRETVCRSFTMGRTTPVPGEWQRHPFEENAEQNRNYSLRTDDIGLFLWSSLLFVAEVSHLALLSQNDIMFNCIYLL